ncbi:hypothetical protein Hanom_Chr10g00945001 [Helianthus anomalus]
MKQPATMEVAAHGGGDKQKERDGEGTGRRYASGAVTMAAAVVTASPTSFPSEMKLENEGDLFRHRR